MKRGATDRVRGGRTFDRSDRAVQWLFMGHHASLWARNSIVLAAIGLAIAPPAWAGMPNLTLTEMARMRVEVISFFLVVLLGAAGLVRLLWNRLRKDFPRLPRITYLKSLGIIGLWGMLFLLILTMISGARELMTPGAWEKDGLLYHVKAPGSTTQPAKPITTAERRTRLAELKAILWDYAQRHDGNLPADDQTPEISPRAWETPDLSRIRFVYVPGAKAGNGNAIVAYEPAAFTGDRLVLKSDGEILTMRLPEITAALRKGERP